MKKWLKVNWFNVFMFVCLVIGFIGNWIKSESIKENDLKHLEKDMKRIEVKIDKTESDVKKLGERVSNIEGRLNIKNNRKE